MSNAEMYKYSDSDLVCGIILDKNKKNKKVGSRSQGPSTCLVIKPEK